MIVLLLTIILTIAVFIRKKSNTIVYLPVFLGIFSSLIFLLLEAELNITGGIFSNSILIIFILFAISRNRKILTMNRYIMLFLIYTFFLIFLSSDIRMSFFRYLNVFIYLFMIPIGYLIINDERKMRILNNSTVALLILFLINFVLVNALKMGNTLYTSDFYMGGFAGGTLYMAAIAVAIFPYAMKKSKNNSYKIFMIFIAFFTILIIAITLRRTAIILALLGIIIYFFSAKKGISTFLGIIFLFIVMTYLSLPFFQKTIISRYELRQERFESDFYEDEGRFLEYGIIFEESLTSLNKFLIGEEIFNSAGYYADGAYGERMIHSGFPALIHGSGYIGLLLFMMIFIKLFFKYWRNRKAIKIYQLTSESQLFISLFVLNIALTASGALLETDTRCLLYIYLGASLGVMEFKIKSLSSNIAQIKNQI